MGEDKNNVLVHIFPSDPLPQMTSTLGAHESKPKSAENANWMIR